MLDQLIEYTLKMAHEQQLIYVNGFDHPWIAAGHGTCGLEILEQVPDADAVVKENTITAIFAVRN